MNIMFLTSSSGTHIIPLKPLIDELLRKGNNIFCLGTISNKAKIESYGVSFIEYPFNMEPNQLSNSKTNEMMLRVNKLWK
ncbi:hypothetical protein, partial [Bacillus paranthracis]|nr:hypothetical protein [Bacillus paranthracis]